MIGTTLGGKYAIVRLLGEGGMGAVYEARHTGTGRRVAVKVIAADLSQKGDLVARFEREARAAGAIESEHIAQVLDVGRDEASGAPFIAMEFLVGEDLEHLFERLGPVPADLALRIGAQACLGLEKAHASGIIHRDIKPANLFLTERDGGELRVKIVDFGIAKALGEEGSQKLTAVGSLLGSPRYMSPEQTRGQKRVDHRTDLWSLGVVLYQALAGRAPFDHAESVADLVVALNTTRPRPVHDLAPWVAPEVAAIVDRALTPDPDTRYATAAEMRAAIEALLPQGTSIRPSMLVSANPTGAPLAPPAGAPAFAPKGATMMEATTPAPLPIVVTPAPLPAVVTPAPVPVIAGLPAPEPPKAAPSGGMGKTLAIAGVMALVATGGAFGGAYALGWIGPPKGDPNTPPSASPSASAADTGSVVTDELRALAGEWWSESGTHYDAVLNGRAMELRVREPDDLTAQGYVAGDVHFTLRVTAGDTKGFRVAARLRPLPLKGTSYDRVRSRTTCENTWRTLDNKPLYAELKDDRLVVSFARIEAPPQTFVREGSKIVGCLKIAEAPVVPAQLVLTRTAPSQAPVRVWPKDAGAPADAGSPNDAGAPKDGGAPSDAGAPNDAGAPKDAGAPHDAGAPKDAGAPTRDAGPPPKVL